MKLIVISPSKTAEEETRIVTELFEHGLETFHLRKPDMRTREMRAYLEKIPAHFHNRIVIHTHHNLAGSFDLKGIHLTRVHLKKRFRTWFRLQMLRMKKPSLTVSTSFHKIGHVYENKRKFSYVFLGTIFDHVSEKFNVGYSEHSLRSVIQKSNSPLIARGGTTADHIQICKSLGFYGIVFNTAVWNEENPIEAFCDLLNRTRELNIPVE